MCNFFTCIVTTLGDVLFTEADSHDIIIMRARFVDNLKHFVRIEYTPIGGYIIDEKTIPEWYERMAAKAKESVKVTHNKVVAAHSAMTKIRTEAFSVYEASMNQLGSSIIPDNVYEWRLRYSSEWVKYKRILFKGIQEYNDKIENIKGYVGPVL